MIVDGIIGGVYRLIDIGNTTVNVLGDMVGTKIVAKAGGAWKMNVPPGPISER